MPGTWLEPDSDSAISLSLPDTSAPTFAHENEEKIYYDDGNLDLIVEGVCFRVYRGVLAQHSEIFKDMFNLCVSSDITDDIVSSTEPSVDKTTVTAIATVQLQDSARDWHHVLYMLFHGRGRSLLLIPDAAEPDELSLYPSFDQLSAYIRLGHKYQISAIYEPAMDYLKRRFASTPDGWKKWTTSRGEPYTLPRCTPAHAIGVVNLARLTGEHALLPLAFLGCAQLGCRRLTDGFMYGDGQRETLSAEDTVLCLDSVPRIASYGAGHVLHVVQQKYQCRNRLDESTSNLCKDTAAALIMSMQSDAYLHKVAYPTPFVLPDPEQALCKSCLLNLDDLNSRALKRLSDHIFPVR